MTRALNADQTKRLEDAGLEPQQAAVLLEVLEDIVGTPLTQDMFDAKSEALKSSLFAKLDLFSAEMTSFKDSIEKSVASLKAELDMRQEALDQSLKSLKTEATLHQQALDQSVTSLKTETALRQEAFENSIEASIAKGRLATLTGIWVIAIGVIALVVRAFISGFPLP